MFIAGKLLPSRACVLFNTLITKIIQYIKELKINSLYLVYNIEAWGPGAERPQPQGGNVPQRGVLKARYIKIFVLYTALSELFARGGSPP
ncbi:hypothetical protein D0T87_13950 [Bacteroides sp. 51]|nr:hypothetical protein [Bacteroides sp. 51]